MGNLHLFEKTCCQLCEPWDSRRQESNAPTGPNTSSSGGHHMPPAQTKSPPRTPERSPTMYDRKRKCGMPCCTTVYPARPHEREVAAIRCTPALASRHLACQQPEAGSRELAGGGRGKRGRPTRFMPTLISYAWLGNSSQVTEK